MWLDVRVGVYDYLGSHGTGLEHYMHCVLCVNGVNNMDCCVICVLGE